jgi:tetratricopeptide (TPR) repeat protein
MAAEPQLDAAGASQKGRVIFLLIAVLMLASPAFAQNPVADQSRLAAAQAAFDAGHWEATVTIARGAADQSAELDFLEGLALARLEKWPEARLAFDAGIRKAPNNSKFLVELAGIAYKQNDFRTAKKRLQAALRRNPKDAYSREFLATIYFLEGNLEAALKFWNPEDKPRLRNVTFVPALQLRESLHNRALAFNAPQVLTDDALLTTQSRLDSLGIFSSQRIELTQASSGNYDVTLHLAERNAWGDGKLEELASLLSGLPYDTVYPQFYNLGQEAVNVTSLARWDPEKRRALLSVSMPVYGDPGLRLRFYADARNENWNLTQTFFGPGASLSNLNLRRVAAGAEIHSVVNGRWSWNGGAEMANRNFRNLSGQTSRAGAPLHAGFFDGSQGWPGVCGRSRTVRNAARIAPSALAPASKRRRL